MIIAETTKTKTTKTFRPAKRCSCCGKLMKATAHLYGPRDFNKAGREQGDGLCPACYEKYVTGRTDLRGGRSGVTVTQLGISIRAGLVGHLATGA